MNIAIYCRVSTSDQDPKNQKMILERFCRDKGWKFKTFTEVESTRKYRSVKSEVLRLLRDKKFDGLLIFKLDRWARSSTELLLEIQELHDKGIIFISYSESIDLSTAIGKLQFAVISAFAEFERSMISERTKAGIARKKQIGKMIKRRGKDKKKRKRTGYLLRALREREAIPSKSKKTSPK